MDLCCSPGDDDRRKTGMMYLQYCTTKRPGSRRVCQLCSTPITCTKETSRQFQSVINLAPRGILYCSGTVGCYKYYEYKRTIRTPQIRLYVYSCSPSGLSKTEHRSVGTRTPHPDVKRRTDAATMKQILEKKRFSAGSGLFRKERD